jgi:hypothetical protein
MAVQGAGVINPGFTALPTASAVYFGGTATVIGTNGVAATFGCAWAGTEIGDLAASVGVAGGGCGPIVFSTCVTVRVATTWLMTCARADTQIGNWSFIGAWTPDQVPPSAVVSYHLAAMAAYGLINSP